MRSELRASIPEMGIFAHRTPRKSSADKQQRQEGSNMKRSNSSFKKYARMQSPLLLVSQV